MANYKIQIKRIDTGEIVETLYANDERTADRIERGVNMNLNHDDYYTKIVEEV